MPAKPVRSGALAIAYEIAQLGSGYFSEGTGARMRLYQWQEGVLQRLDEQEVGVEQPAQQIHMCSYWTS